MTDENDVRSRVERAIGQLQDEWNIPLPLALGQERTIRLRDQAVAEIMSSGDPEASKLIPTNFVSELLVHNNYGSFTPGPDGKLRVRLR
jgi:hypothetical protein